VPRKRKRSQSRTRKLWVVAVGRFDEIRTKESGGSTATLDNNHASFSLPADVTHRDVIEELAKRCDPPLPIESLSGLEGGFRYLRAITIFSNAREVVERVARNYEGVHWWVSEHGLNMCKIPLSVKPLSEFDRLAGKLYAETATDGRLSKAALLAIALQLDDAKLSLKDHLQPQFWALIAQHNQKNPKSPIKTFVKACSSPRFQRSVRRRLYVARENYLTSISPIPEVS
jgi:hypothetical protein